MGLAEHQKVGFLAHVQVRGPLAKPEPGALA